MRLLIFDTETTGLPKTRSPATEGPNNWPHIVSMSWLIIDDGVIVKQRNYIVKPEGWTIPLESTKIHGITTLQAHAEGEPLLKVVSEFMSEVFDGIVAHNVDFDYNVLMNAIRWDVGMEFNGFSKPLFCTMKLSTKECGLLNGWGTLKFPSLKELYYNIFKRYPDITRLHGSLYDVTVLCECIQHCEWLQKKIYSVDVVNK